MPCSFARFVVYYKNGEMVVEDRNDGYSWDNLKNKKNITAIGILYDPLILNEKDEEGNQLRLTDVPKSLILRSSDKHEYRFFQFKTVDMQLGKSKDRSSGRYETNLTIGMVVDKEGHCIVTEAMPDMKIRTYYTSVKELRLNLELFEIELEEIY